MTRAALRARNAPQIRKDRIDDAAGMLGRLMWLAAIVGVVGGLALLILEAKPAVDAAVNFEMKEW